MDGKFEKHLLVDQPKTVIECLSQHIHFSKQQLKTILNNGAVWLEDNYGVRRVRRAKKNLQPKDQIHVYYDAHVQMMLPPEPQLVADEGEYSIWNKPCGLLSQGSKWGDHCTISRWSEIHLLPQRPAFIVHRLDRAANGLIVIAHKKTIAAAFSKMFACHAIDKIYQAQVEGCIQDMKLPCLIESKINNKTAISEILSLKVNVEKNITLLTINIKTGRKHQIRKHLSELGYPIIGDRLYGSLEENQDLQLSSIHLSFQCPVSGIAKTYQLES